MMRSVRRCSISLWVVTAGKYEAAPDDSQVPRLWAGQLQASGLHHPGQQELALHLPGQLRPLPALLRLGRSEEAGRGQRGGGEPGGQTTWEESNPVWIVVSSGELTLTTPITTSSQQYFVQHKTRWNVTTCLSAEEKKIVFLLKVTGFYQVFISFILRNVVEEQGKSLICWDSFQIWSNKVFLFQSDQTTRIQWRNEPRHEVSSPWCHKKYWWCCFIVTFRDGSTDICLM